MLAYTINLDSATGRWEHIVQVFHSTDIGLVRVPAVDGRTMQLGEGEFDADAYRRLHGREINLFEVACYLSHVRAMRTFLDTSDEESAIILEDDVSPSGDIDAVVAGALKFADRWDILRLSGLSRGKPVRVGTMAGGYSMCVNLGRLKGAGAYMVNRRAARRLVDHLLPIVLPYDHAFDREWFVSLSAASLLPFPFSQTSTGFRSSIQHNSKPRLGRISRYRWTYPYQAFNEVSRYVYRLGAIARWKARDVPGAVAVRNHIHL